MDSYYIYLFFMNFGCLKAEYILNIIFPDFFRVTIFSKTESMMPPLNAIPKA